MKNEIEPEMISTLIFNKLINVKELTRLKYYYTNMEQFENKNTFTSIKLPLKSKKFIISYDEVIHAGFDLKKWKLS